MFPDFGTTAGVDYIRLVDMTGRVVQEWQQPKATAQGFQLAREHLITGIYLLEAIKSTTKYKGCCEIEKITSP
ncbi:MAG: hypothetical protein ACRBFS_03835 [Aureispira sp.]